METTREFFDRTAPAFLANYRQSTQFKERLLVWQEAIDRVLPRLPAGATCLDMGCGDGLFGRMLACRGIRTIGIDQSDTMLAMARALDLETGLRSRYESASIPLPVELESRYAASVDLILCSNVLEYVVDYQSALEQFFRLLKPNGLLLLSLPNRSSVYRAWERALQRVLSFMDSYLRQQRHQFCLPDAKRLLDRIGYSVVDQTFFALPAQEYSERIFGRYRGPLVATMFLMTAVKRERA